LYAFPHQRSEGARDIITELDLVAAREQLQDLDARETVKGDAEGEDLEVNFDPHWVVN
jgi:hypothetical protein